MRSIVSILASLLIVATALPARSGGSAPAGGDTKAEDSKPESDSIAAETDAPEQGSTQEEPLFRAPTRRIIVVDSRDLGPELAATSTVLHGEEMREIVEISEHKGDSLQLLLWNPPWDGPVLFHPGIAVPLESRAAKERRQKEAAEQKAAADRAAQTQEKQ